MAEIPGDVLDGQPDGGGLMAAAAGYRASVRV
jgi:hypothetical protein